MTEAIFNYRWEQIKGWYDVGELVAKNKLTVEETAAGIGRRKREIHYAKELYLKYPNLDSLPEGKNISWNKLHKYLPPYEDKSKIKKTK